MNCPHLQALFQVGVFFCMNLNQPHCKKKNTCEGLAHPESSLAQITDYFISDVSTCFCSPSPQNMFKKDTHQVFTSSSQSQGTVWLSILPPLVEHSTQIPTKPSLRMLSTVAPSGSGLEPRGWQGGTTLPCTAPGVKPCRVVVGW